jgi:hypothetical protein
MKASAGTGNRKGKRIPIKNLFAVSGTFLHNESMKNKEHQISGAINTGVSVRAGNHEYEEGHPEVVEIAFRGYNSTYIQVIDMETAKDLKKQLEFLL